MSDERSEYFEMLFASTPGVNFRRLAGEASKRLPTSSPKHRKFMEELYGAPVKITAKGKESRVARQGTTNDERRGFALSGLLGAPLYAGLYSFSMDWTQRPVLFRVLREHVAEVARREEWPEYIRGAEGINGHYQDKLTALILDMEWLRPLAGIWDEKQVNSKKPYVSLEARFLGITEEIWRTKVMHYHIRPYQRFEAWKARARGYIEHGIAEHMHRLDGSPFDPTNPAKAARQAA